MGVRGPGEVTTIAALAAAVALAGSTLIGWGPPGYLPPTCTAMALSVAVGVTGEATPESALELWLDESASPLTPRAGWRTVPGDGVVYSLNVGRRVEISDLSRGSGSGWMVTAANCV